MTSATRQSELPDKPGLTRRVARGSLWSLGGQGANLLASMVATPFVIRLLGPEAYGVWALITVTMGYMAFTNLGMAATSTRFAAEMYGKGDEDGEVAVFWTSLLILSIPTLLAGIALFYGARPLVLHGLRIPEHLHDEAVLAFQLTALVFMAQSLAGVLNTPQLVRLRLDIYTLIHAGCSVGQIFLVPIVLLFGGKLPSAVGVMLAAAAASVLLHAYFSWRLVARLAKPVIQLRLMGPLLRFGSSIILITLLGVILFHSEKPLLARLASVKILGYYAVAFVLARMLAVMPGALSQSLLPALSRLQAGTDRAPLEGLYDRTLRGVILWSLPTVMIIWVMARPFLWLWAGGDFARESLLPLRILLLGALFDGVSHVPRCLLEAVGKPHLVARCQLVEVVPFLGLAYYSIIWFGAAGAAAVWSLRAVVEALWIFREAHRVSGFAGWNRIARPAIATALSITALPVIVLELTSPPPEVMASLLVVVLMLYGVLVWNWILTPGERVWVANIMKEVTRGRFTVPAA